jgi:malonyl CoA-acyl carrier protein transacylase
MLPEDRFGIIAFVWRPEEITPSVTEMAHRTGSRAIFDFSGMESQALHSFLRQAAQACPVEDIKISSAAFMDPSLGRLLKEIGVGNLWVECHTPSIRGDISVFLQRLRELSETCRCFPIVGDLDILATMMENRAGIGRIALKGCEASGFVSGETTQFLYAAAREMLRDTANAPDIILWGGVWMPEAAAAFLSTGAAGIVFESVHWLTDLVALEDPQRRQLAKLRADSTTLVGLDLQVPCRLFNKGNSVAFQEIKAFEDSLCATEITEESRRRFVDHLNARSVHPLKSQFTKDQTIPLGVEAAFAASFTERFGTGTEQAINAFLEEIETLCRSAETKKDCFVDCPSAKELGTKYPFIQGAMSSITDLAEFAARIADAGGLPTIALGLMNAEALDRRLGRLPEVMGGRSYAVNIISLAENPFRETQLDWIKKNRPRFVWIAGGDISPIRDLLDCGIGVVYIAPDEALLKLALDAGVRYVVCEGYEAGGHVGQQSMLTLAQIVLDLKRRQPALFGDCRVILAGGIYNRQTAFLAAMLGADALQMGTAYLATQEIVETGAMTALYQRMVLESPPGGTVVTGRSTGLRVRSLRSPRVAAVLSLERRFAAGHQDETSFRKNMEEMTAGSLFVAARGMDKQGKPLSEQACMERGQFMSGACAGLIHTAQTLESFHRELAQGALVLHQPFPETHKEKASPVTGPMTTPSFGVGRADLHHGDPERIAITGMSIVNALGKSPEETWAASLALKSGITVIPSSWWDQQRYYDPRPHIVDKSYCNVGALIDFQASRSELGIPPHDFRTMTEATRITMWLADKAIRASGILESGIPRERIGVLISQNSGETAGTLTPLLIRGNIHDILAAIRQTIPVTPEQEHAIEKEIKSRYMAPDDTTLLGRLNCAAAGFICNKYGFMGPSFSVSAACATSLVALHCAFQMIRNGILDAAIVGGAEEKLTHMHFIEFSAIGALYGLSGRERPARESSRPFDAQRDGMVLGEGGGMIVIERESLAHKRGVPIHAMITNMGASNNHLGMVESSSVTQEIAIGNSFHGISYGPDAVDMVECHATSTRQGDVEEVRALKTFFTPSGRTLLTSFKSQIGHTLGASGINSLIRGVTAMKAGVLPPTLNYEHPDPQMGLEGSGLFVAPEPLDWKRRDGRPRRFQVNAFGFGGSNYVVQLEQALHGEGTVLISPGKEAQTAGGPSSLQGVSFFRTKVADGACRMAVTAQSEQEAIAAIEKSASLFDAGIAAPKTLRSLAQRGIYICPERAPIPPMAFVFPGQGTHYMGMGRELYESFGAIREWMDKAAAVADFDLLDLLFHGKEENLQKTRWQQPALFTMEYAMAQYLVSLGVTPSAMAGHSLGELTALCMAGVYSMEDGFRIVNMRARCMDKAAAMNMDPGVMAAVDAPLEMLNGMMRGQEHIYIGNINSPNQIILSGNTEVVKNLGRQLKEKGFRFTLLRVSMAFHSPIMRVIHEELDAFVATIPFHAPTIPVISNTTKAPYPSDSVEIRRILMAHLESTVHWKNNVQTLWDDYGIRHFVEVGPGDILTNLITDTLPDSACIQTCIPPAERLSYTTALAQLFVQGHLKVRREPRFVSISIARKAPASGRSAGTVGAAPAKAPGLPDPIEALIQIIMDATGFNRDEIQPDMDLRRDLSIRSSRLPIIMDAAEHHFGITIELEDFIQVRTVRDIAQKIAEIVARKQGTNPPSAAPAVPSAPAIADGQAVPAPAETPELPDSIEALIQIIMDATGFNRDEIQPEMDLRRDLSIRSSRLPIIMDAAERHFGITIELEEFIQVRTVKDIAQKISELVARKNGTSQQPAMKTAQSGVAQKETQKPLQDEASIKRLVFKSVLMERSAPAPIQLSRGESVLILSPGRDDEIAKNVGDLFRQVYGADTIPLQFLKASGAGQEGYDLLTDEGSRQVSQRMSSVASLAGMVLALPKGWSEKLKGLSEVSRLLRGLLLPLKAFLQSPAKKFVVLIHSREDAETLGRMPVEGMLGMFLSASQEYSSVQFRTLEIDKAADLRAAVSGALDRGYAAVEMIHRDGKVFTSEAQVAPSNFENLSNLNLNPGDIVVMSGGASGIGAHLARGLVPYRPRIVFLGRTPIDTAFPSATASMPPLSGPNPSGRRASEIAGTLADLRSLGIEAAYYPCDVTDPKAVDAVVGEVVKRYGKIDGIIHGAGVLRDGFLDPMIPDDFSTVVDTKFLGAGNLFSAARKAGLKFFVGLSSVAAIQGNPGQTNYAAANRMMSALIRSLRLKNGAVRFKALMLPPIEGAGGMAEDPEVREMLKRKGVGYIHVSELAGLFCRELFVAPADDDWVMFMRGLPAVKAARINDTLPPLPHGQLGTGTVAFRRETLPMIEAITGLDLRQGQLEAARSFSQDKDLWIADHKPFPFIQHPLVSAAMVLETFMEAARVVYPHLQVRGVGRMRFMDMIQCPLGILRPCTISCRRIDAAPGEAMCEVSLSAQEMSPTGRLMDRFTPHYTGRVILDGGHGQVGEGFSDFPIRPDELRTRPMDTQQVLRWYADCSGFKGRYCVIDRLDGAGPGVVRGHTIYRQTSDFAHLQNAEYQYSPYLFEAMMQLIGFSVVATAPTQRQAMIPVEVGQMRFSRKCRDGEPITLEARMRSEDEQGFVWDARGVDDHGRTIMQVTGLRLQKVAE